MSKEIAELLAELTRATDHRFAKLEGRLRRVESGISRDGTFADRDESDGRMLRVEQGQGCCNGCGTIATVLTLEIATSEIQAKRGHPYVPPGWCALIGLCPKCWGRVNVMREEQMQKGAFADSAAVRRSPRFDVCDRGGCGHHRERHHVGPGNACDFCDCAAYCEAST